MDGILTKKTVCDSANENGFKGKKKTAFDKALDMLARRMRTEKQVREGLGGRAGGGHDYGQREIDDAVERLKGLGYIDDRDYAERFLETLIEKRRGRRRIKEEMRRRGLGAGLVDDVVDGGFSAEAERENALAVAEKALAGLPPQSRGDWRKTAQKLSGRLVTQGYDFDLINPVIDGLRERLAQGYIDGDI